MTTLISFDVDGTLIISRGDNSNKLHKLAFAAAIKQVFAIETGIDAIKHHGSTDPLILVSILTHHGVPKSQAMAKLKDMEAVMNDYFLAHAGAEATTGLEVLPGVSALLQALKDRDDVITCLVTGNLEPIGWTKMEALGLAPLFTQPRFGGFGSDYCSDNHKESWEDRAQLVRVAADRAANQHKGAISSRYHVGDTPMDLQAAGAGGAIGVGVTTGIFNRDELSAASPGSLILDGLQDLPQTLKAFGLSK